MERWGSEYGRGMEGVWDVGDPESRINNNICQASWSYFSLSPLRLIRYATWAR